MLSLDASAQERLLTGRLTDRDTKEAMIQTTVQLLNADSVFVAGNITDESGTFRITVPDNGRYILKISSVGYATTFKDIVVSDNKNTDVGNIILGADAVMLKGVTATAQALKMTVVNDTFVYNAAAYRTPEGSVVEELVKRIPGAQIDDSGNITINGKTVNKIKVDGKEFMTGDTKTAIKNLPTSIVDRVKAYSDKSDMTKETGIDDGDEIMTLDFSIKRGMNKGMMINADLAYGTEERYAERIMGAYFKDKFRVISFGNFNNTNDMGFGGRGGGFGSQRNGLNTSNMLGANFNYEDKDKLEIDGSVRWNHNTNNSLTKTSSEQFVTSLSAVQSFSNRIAQNFSKNKSWNAQARLKWMPDSMTSIMFRPRWRYSDNDARSGATSGTFSSDPYEYTSDPLANIEILKSVGIIKNLRTGSSLSYGDSRQISAVAQFTRKLNNEGRNITLRVEADYSKSNGQSLSTSNVEIFDNPKTYSINRYNTTPSNSWGYQAKAAYNEPIARKTYLQFSYEQSYSYSKTERSTYDFSNVSMLSPDYVTLLSSLGFSNIPAYRTWNTYLPDNYSDYLDNSLSRQTEYRTLTHDIEVQLRRVTDKYNFSIGFLVQPQHTSFKQNYLSVRTDTARNVLNISPTLNFKYNFSKQHQLRINYRGKTTQPSVSDMISIVDDSDPLNVSYGNPGLKPSFTNNFRFNYNNYLANHNQVIELHGNFSTTRNATTRRVTYNAETGGMTTRPENINGNWNASLGGIYNISLDSIGNWNVNSSTDYSYNNYVGLVSTSALAESQRNITRSHNINERLAGSYRNKWLEIEVDGSVNYTHSTNQLQPSANLDTWAFSYGLTATVNSSWGMSISSDFHVRSRRGYNDASLNTNEFVWNAQIAQSFLKAKNLTLSLQFYDILHQQSNLSRTLSAMSRTDTEYNSINSYAMLHAIYRFNAFGGKDMRSQFKRGKEGSDYNRPEYMHRGAGGGSRPRGGFGGPR